MLDYEALKEAMGDLEEDMVLELSLIHIYPHGIATTGT